MLSNTLRLNFCYLKIIYIFHQRYHPKNILKKKQKNKCDCIHEIIELITKKIFFFFFLKMAHDNDNTCISEERLTALIRKILTEELEKQQQGLLKLISGNFEITMK